MVLDELPEGRDEVYEWNHIDGGYEPPTDDDPEDPLELGEDLQTELDDFYEQSEEEEPDYSGEPRPRVINTQFMGRRNYAREPGRTTDFDW